MTLNHRLLEILACPACKGKLHYLADRQLLLCRAERLVYPIENGIPQLLDERARAAAEDEL